MRASDQDHDPPRHLSGAERLVEEDVVSETVKNMLERAQAKDPTKIQITLEIVPTGCCTHVHCLPVHTVHTASEEQAAAFASVLLVRAGVAPTVALAGLSALRKGLGKCGTALRGASLWDRLSGRRLEPDHERGVRTSRFDYSSSGAIAVDDAFTAYGLTHFRTREALAVATKTLWSGVSAELCWSDDPNYATGYVATPRDGYVRLPGFRPADARGGRIFFIDSEVIEIETFVQKLEREYVLIDPPVVVSERVSVEEFLERA